MNNVRSISSLLARRSWRDERRTRLDDDELRAEFQRRARDLREEVQFVLRNGLNEGAMDGLSTLAEQDMLDFEIMVDLGANVLIETVDPLDGTTRQHLEEFLAGEPWLSLAVDHDIDVLLAMVEAVALDSDRRPWYESAPQLYRLLAETMDRANAEQIQRFAAELSERSRLSGFDLPEDTTEHLRQIIAFGARRVGTKPPLELFS